MCLTGAAVGTLYNLVSGTKAIYSRNTNVAVLKDPGTRDAYFDFDYGLMKSNFQLPDVVLNYLFSYPGSVLIYATLWQGHSTFEINMYRTV